MDTLTELLLGFISIVLINNLVLTKFLGICPFLGVSNKVSTSVGMSGAVLFVMTLATLATYLLYEFILVPSGLDYLRTTTFILVIASLVQMVEIVLKKVSPPLYQALGIFLPLITTNCAVLGTAILCIRREQTFPEAIVFAIASASGFTLALILLAGIRERLEIADVPKALRGTAIGLIMAGLMSLAFFGFVGVDGSLKALLRN